MNTVTGMRSQTGENLPEGFGNDENRQVKKLLQ